MMRFTWLEKSDIDNLVKPYIKKYIADISNYLKFNFIEWVIRYLWDKRNR